VQYRKKIGQCIFFLLILLDFIPKIFILTIFIVYFYIHFVIHYYKTHLKRNYYQKLKFQYFNFEIKLKNILCLSYILKVNIFVCF